MGECPNFDKFSYMRTTKNNNTVFSRRYAHALVMLDLRKMGDELITECIFPYSYTKFETETRPKQGDALLTEGARISERIQYCK